MFLYFRLYGVFAMRYNYRFLAHCRCLCSILPHWKEERCLFLSPYIQFVCASAYVVDSAFCIFA